MSGNGATIITPDENDDAAVVVNLAKSIVAVGVIAQAPPGLFLAALALATGSYVKSYVTPGDRDRVLGIQAAQERKATRDL